ncbi:Homeodomain-like DNA binding domain-containing transcription factor [Mucor lusitanicus]|uniref:Homeodomain-like DNA binding domain-containing transcription factor n=2 Tax=Mucor circinelloides f. lusitanicus TaxID=29924 RepID=A0A168Q8S8_MUCCL|nr:Homeodomain-like DNA binding domain-containing transcription factor [Mucor lusitanicus]OAD08876.1 Homeodomain-like DNA binding domain-containing transcription factor [Mucor lusitanicus CBS 277.49]
MARTRSSQNGQTKKTKKTRKRSGLPQITRCPHIRQLIMEKSYDQLKTPTEIARELNISRETISGIIKRYEETGSIEYKSVGGDNRSKIKEHHRQFLLNAIEENNTITLEELQSKLIKEFGDIQSIGLSTLCKFLKHNAEKITLKRAAPRGKKRNGPDTHKV